MAKFDDIFADAARPVLLDNMGRTITYRPHNGDAVAITAVVEPEAASERQDEQGRDRRRRRVVIISTAASGGIASPSNKDTLDIGTEEWSVETIENHSGSLARLLVVRIGSVERSRPQYRGQA